MKRQNSLGATKEPINQQVVKTEEEDKSNGQLPIDLFRLFSIRNEELRKPDNLPAFYHMFTCPICKSLLKSPLVLPCSHRFCRSCLEIHAKKLGDNKLCLVCRMAVKTKKDIKEDKAMETMIQKIFGNADIFRLEICKAEAKEMDRQKQHQEKRKETAGIRSVKKKKEGEVEPIMQSVKVQTPKPMKRVIMEEPLIVRPDLILSQSHSKTSPIIIDDEGDTKATEISQFIQKKHDIQAGSLYKTIEEDLGVLLGVRLKKIPEDILTKQIEKSGLQTLTKTTLHQIKIHLCRSLRLDEKQQVHMIKLYRVAQHRRISESTEGITAQTQKFLVEMVDDQMTLGQLNEKYWYNIRSDYSVFSVQDIIEAIRLKIKPHIPSERLIYYKVDYSQIKTVM